MREIIYTNCCNCKKEQNFDYVNVDKTVPKGTPDIIVKCEVCGEEKHISEKEWVKNCNFI